MAGRTPSQTVGPYYAICLPWIDGGKVTGGNGAGVVAFACRVRPVTVLASSDDSWLPATVSPVFSSTAVVSHPIVC